MLSHAIILDILTPSNIFAVSHLISCGVRIETFQLLLLLIIILWCRHPVKQFSYENQWLWITALWVVHLSILKS